MNLKIYLSFQGDCMQLGFLSQSAVSV